MCTGFIGSIVNPIGFDGGEGTIFSSGSKKDIDGKERRDGSNDSKFVFRSPVKAR
jgi:hypothetical protein